MNVFLFEQILSSLKHLNDWLNLALNNSDNSKNLKLQQVLKKTEEENKWFTPSNVRHALKNICSMLSQIDDCKDLLMSFYCNNPKRIAIIMAGNIPAVGFQDLLHTLLTGNHVICKLSKNDSVIIPFLIDTLIQYCPNITNYISISEQNIKPFDAVIATGSNNTSRYFQYYFSKYPHIIRKNRNSIAVISGQETIEELKLLADDVFIYFGLGCRNVSALFVPKDYDFTNVIIAFKAYSFLSNHHKYISNYEYYHAVFVLNNIPFINGNFFLITQQQSIQSPPSVLYFQYYQSIEEVQNYISAHKDDIQCVVSSIPEIKSIPFGSTQKVGLLDFADGINTLEFLKSLESI